jgi:hypothetical protein
MKTTLIVLAFMAGSLTAAPLPNAGKSQETHRPTYADSVSGSISDVALRHVRRDVLDANVAMMKRGDDADDAYHTITPHSKRGDDADDAYHTITPMTSAEMMLMTHTTPSLLTRRPSRS